MKSSTRIGETLRWGMSDPGMAATARAKRRTSAVRIDVSWAQTKRSPPRQPSRGRSGPVGSGAESAWPAGRVWVSVIGSRSSWVGAQIAGVKEAKVARSSAVMAVHRPLTSSSPTTTIRMPPARITATW